jgi:hypothetical protein
MQNTTDYPTTVATMHELVVLAVAARIVVIDGCMAGIQFRSTTAT